MSLKSRPSPKSAEAQGAAIVFRTRDLLVRQRTQLINALRVHLAEFGFDVHQGAWPRAWPPL